MRSILFFCFSICLFVSPVAFQPAQATATVAPLKTASPLAPETKLIPPKPVRKKRPQEVWTIPNVPRNKVICFALYTVHNRILKINTQLYPLQKGESRKVRLEVKRNGKWVEIATAKIIEDGWTAPFRIEKWDDTKDVPYRIAHGKAAFFEGRIRKNPVDKKEIVLAGFTGNASKAWLGGQISREDIVNNIKKINPDILFFSGDQVYTRDQHYALWLKFGRDFGEIIKDRPTITIPDDHDVGQGNLWGAEGKKSAIKGGSDGGYTQPLDYVKRVERAQTSHLPDPVDPRPVQRGIKVYFTNMTWGRISFAILEDRKFKTGPKGLFPWHKGRPDHIADTKVDTKKLDVPQAVLLGKRQLKFLENWTQDWSNADMKVALSQTIFCGGAHMHGRIGGRLHADLDSNGWPQTGRNKAVAALRKGFAVHLAGDQHLGTVFHHGIDEFRDSIYSFCVPSIANLYLRWWSPLTPGGNRKPGQHPFLGDHLDTFQNKVTCHAHANPPTKQRMNGDKLTTRAAGFGIMRFNKKTRKITMECWPRKIDITSPTAKQYPGWPITIDQLDNYGRKAIAYLPTITVTNAKNPVVQIVEEKTKEVVYTLRINGSSFRPKVFTKGTYTIHVGEGATRKTFRKVPVTDPKNPKKQILNVKF